MASLTSPRVPCSQIVAPAERVCQVPRRRKYGSLVAGGDALNSRVEISRRYFVTHWANVGCEIRSIDTCAKLERSVSVSVGEVERRSEPGESQLSAWPKFGRRPNCQRPWGGAYKCNWRAIVNKFVYMAENFRIAAERGV